MTEEQKKTTAASKWEVEKLIKGFQYKQNNINEDVESKLNNIPSRSTIEGIVEDYMTDNPPTISGLTIGSLSQADPNVFVGYKDTNYLSHCINIGPNFFPSNGSYYVACGYGLKNGYNLPGVSVFGKYNNITGWGGYNVTLNKNYKPKFAVGTGTDDSHRETAILFADYDGQPKWYLKGIGYDDTVGLGYDRDNYVNLDDTQLDLKTYIDNGDNIFAPDDIVDYFKLPMLKLDICVDSGGTLTITTNKQCAKLPLGNTNSYYAPQGTKEYFSGVTPTWVDNQNGTYTYTLTASESNLTGYSGQYEWMSIDPINFYVEDGVTYRTLITTKKEWDNHFTMRNHIVAKRDYVKQGLDGGGNEFMPEGMQYNPNHAPYYQVTAWQLAQIMSNINS